MSTIESEKLWPDGECGCAPLIITASLKEFGCNVHGIDIDPSRFYSTISTIGLNMSKCDIETEPPPLDTVSCGVVIFKELFSCGGPPTHAIGISATWARRPLGGLLCRHAQRLATWGRERRFGAPPGYISIEAFRPKWATAGRAVGAWTRSRWAAIYHESVADLGYDLVSENCDRGGRVSGECGGWMRCKHCQL